MTERPRSIRKFKRPSRQHRSAQIIADADPKLRKVFERISRPDAHPFKPDAYQVKAVSIITEGHDCLVTAPTGSGKTWIAIQAIDHFILSGGTVWYSSPLKALSNAKFHEFSEAFGAHRVGILTGDRKENSEAPVIVGTTEILRNHLYDAMRHGIDLKANLIILDEAHFLGDPERGVVWEEIMIYLPVRIPMLLLSATIGNAFQIAGWLMSLRDRPCEVVHESQRPVPLYPLFFHPSGTLLPLFSDKGKGTRKKIHPKVFSCISAPRPPSLTFPGGRPPYPQILNVLRKYNLLPAIFFLKSRADCDAALTICEAGKSLDSHRSDLIENDLQKILNHIPHLEGHRQLYHLKQFGIGSHHGGQLPAWKLTIETLMSRGLLDAVFATSTVAAGVNFPARSVLFFNSDKFNGIEFLPLSPTEFHQMTGRAGRRGMDRIGFAIVLPDKYMDTRLVAELFVSSPSDVISQIKINFSMTLNLLLSHNMEQIQKLLHRSFAAFQHAEQSKKKPDDRDNAELYEDFMRHFLFLKHTGYVLEDGTLSESGLWASQLRIDHPLILAEALRLELLPKNNPRMLAAILASFVNDRDTDERLHGKTVPNPLKSNFQKTTKALKPFMSVMTEWNFSIPQLFLSPSFSLFQWASGLYSWERVITETEASEGDLAMLILRTADHLRHLIGLKDTFSEIADSAAQALELIVREPLTTHF